MKTTNRALAPGFVVAILVCVMIAGQAFAELLSIRVCLVITFLTVFLASWRLLGAVIPAAAVVAPLVVITPWHWPHSLATTMGAFTMAATLFWAAWLIAESPAVGPRASLAASLIFAAAFSVLPPTVFLAVPAALYRLWRGSESQQQPRRFVLICPVAVVSISFVLWMFLAGGLGPMTIAAMFSPALDIFWNVPALSQAVHRGAYTIGMMTFNKWFYVPMLVALAPSAWRMRKRWWFAPTFIWAATLSLGAALFGKKVYFHESLVLQVCLLVPFGLVAAAELSDILSVEHPRLCRMLRLVGNASSRHYSWGPQERKANMRPRVLRNRPCPLSSRLRLPEPAAS
jgi:hypothetical protein